MTWVGTVTMSRKELDRPRIGGRVAFEEPLGPRGTLRNIPTRT
jgi:hypothetical protein